MEPGFEGRGDMFAAASGGGGYHCCPAVFDPYTLVALIGGVALATYFLRVVIVTTTFGRSFPTSSTGWLPGLDTDWAGRAVQELLQLYQDELSQGEAVQEKEEPVVVGNHTNVETGECRGEVWRCVSGVLEGGARWLHRPADIYK